MAPDPYKLLPRLAKFVDGFACCFSRKKQADHAQRYVRGLLSDARRKNIESLWGRLTEDCDYQSLQHFMTHSTWDWQRVWSQLRTGCLDRDGILAIDDTGVPKQGRHSVGVHRQYSGTLGKVGNCQVVVSSVLRAPKAIWPLAMDLYLPESWAEDSDRRDGAGVPASVSFRTKWQIAIAQVDQVLAAGIHLSCVTADAGYGDCSEFRAAITERRLPFSVGVSSSFKAFAESPRFETPPANPMGRPRTRKKLSDDSPKPMTAAEITDAAPASKWRKVTWRQGSKGALSAEF